MKAAVFSQTGAPKKEVSLPAVFETLYRPDLIKRAFLAERSKARQAYGADPHAGKRTTAENWGTGRGIARVRRVKSGPNRKGRHARKWSPKFRSFMAAGKGAFSPQTVGGFRAHPPKADKIYAHKINKKEKALAIKSAIAATATAENVSARGHRIENIKSLPIIIESESEKISKTNDAVALLEKLHLGAEMMRCSTRKIRAGKGKMRGRKYRQPVGPLFVVGKNTPLASAVRNVAGVSVSSPEALTVTLLSPGAHGARLTIWSEDAIKKVGEQHG